MNRLFLWLVLVLLLGCFGIVAFRTFQAQAEAGKGMPAYSVYSNETNGLAGTAQLLRKLGFEPVAVTRPIQHTQCRGLLIMVEPDGEETGSEITQADVKALTSWVAKGNTLLLCSHLATALHEAFSVTLNSGFRNEREESQEAAVDETGFTEGIDHLLVKEGTVRADQSLPLWWVDREPGAVLLERGQGLVVVMADPSFLTLEGLWRGDNVTFLYNVARLKAQGGRVYFDEYHHGLRASGGLWGFLRYYHQQWLLLQLLLVVVVAVWAVAVRLGPVVPRVKEAQADAVDYASAVARIYQGARVRQLLAKTLVRDFMTVLARHLRLPRSALPAEILASWQRHHGQRSSPGNIIQPAADNTPTASAGRLQRLMRGVTQLRGGTITERQLLSWTQEFDRFKVEVLRVR